MTAREGRSARPLPDSGVAKDGGAAEAANFVANATAELAQLARRHDFETLGYLLDMAQLEANEIVRLHIKPEKS